MDSRERNQSCVAVAGGGLRPDPQPPLYLALAFPPIPDRSPSLIGKEPPLLSLGNNSILVLFLFSLDFIQTPSHQVQQIRLGCHSFSPVIHVIVLIIGLHTGSSVCLLWFVYCGSRRCSAGYLLACPLVSTIKKAISLRYFRRTHGNGPLLFRCHRPAIPTTRLRQCIQRNPS